MSEPTYMTEREVRSVVNWVCDRLLENRETTTKQRNAIDRVRICVIRFRNGLVSSIGQARYGIRYEIRLSRPLFLRASIKDRYETIVHEVCHLVAFALWGREGRGHGHLWKSLMVACSVPPDRCHAVGNRDLVEQGIVRCNGCGRHRRSRAERVKSGRRMRCTRCGTSGTVADGAWSIYWLPGMPHPHSK